MSETPPETPLPLAPGDRVPDFLLPDPGGVIRSFYERTRGRPIVIAFMYGEDGVRQSQAIQARLERR